MWQLKLADLSPKMSPRVLIALVCLFASTLSAAVPEGVNLATMKGWDIVVAPDAIASEAYAAQEFQTFFAQASGEKLAIVSEVDRPDRHVFIGPSEALRASDVGFDVEEMGGEDLRIVIRDGNIAIAGGRTRGTLYGVYTFLEDYVGVRFLAPDCTHVPAVGDWLVVGPVDRFYHPPQPVRWSYFSETNLNRAFAARLRCNTTPKDARFGGITPWKLVSHTFGRQVPASKYAKEHPEYYCMIDGKRFIDPRGDHKDMLCLTNPDVVRIITESVLDEIKRNPGRMSVSISQNDTLKQCECPNCVALDKREGTGMGTMLTLVNAVAKEVAKKYPNVTVGVLAYQYTRKPPKNIRPAPNVRIQLCTIECSVIQPLTDPNCELNASFMRDLIGWTKITDDLCIWNYNTNFHNLLLPCPNLRVIEPNIRLFTAHNVRGIFMQGGGYAVGAEFSTLRNYVISRLLWNPGLSGEQLINEFLNLYYRKAAGSIRQFIDLVQDNADAKGIVMDCFGSAADFGLDDEAIAAKSLEICQQALRLADDDVIRARVEVAQIWAYRLFVEDAWLWTWDNRRTLDEDKLDPAVARRVRPYLRLLLELCRKHGVTHWQESTSINAAEALLKKAYGLKKDERI